MLTTILRNSRPGLRWSEVADRSLRGIPPRSGKRQTVSLVLMAALLISLLVPGVATAGKPDIDPSWAEGQIVYMIGPHLITNPNPNLYAQSEELYLLVYPINPDGRTDLGPLTVGGGYHPNCDPCFHPGIPLQFSYHDHVLTGAPGLGNNGTAGVFKGPWKIILLVYNPEVALSSTFKPITRARDIDPAEAGGAFLAINPDPHAANPYEIETGTVLVCPLVSPSA